MEEELNNQGEQQNEGSDPVVYQNILYYEIQYTVPRQIVKTSFEVDSKSFKLQELPQDQVALEFEFSCRRPAVLSLFFHAKVKRCPTTRLIEE